MKSCTFLWNLLSSTLFIKSDNCSMTFTKEKKNRKPSQMIFTWNYVKWNRSGFNSHFNTTQKLSFCKRANSWWGFKRLKIVTTFKVCFVFCLFSLFKKKKRKKAMPFLYKMCFRNQINQLVILVLVSTRSYVLNTTQETIVDEGCNILRPPL